MKNLLVLIILFISIIGYTQSLRELFNKSIEAYKAKDYIEFERLNLEALKIHPSQPTLLFNLAASYALNDKNENALKTLVYLLSWNANLKFQEEEDLKKMLMNNEVLLQLNSKVEKFTAKKETGATYFELSDKYHLEDLVIIKDIAYLTDVRNGTILKYNLKSNDMEELITLPGAALAIVAAKEKNCIWVSTSVLENYNKYSKAQNNKSNIYKIDTKKKSIVTRIEIPFKAVLGSMVLTKNDELLATSSAAPKIIVVNTKSSSIDKTIELKDAFNLQGIALDDNQKYIYVADYIKGVAKIDIDDFSKIKWYKSDEYLLKGIDGLSYINDETLIAIQNNSNPKKVIKLSINDDKVSDVELLENALPYNGEPTNGKFYPKIGFIYLANSQWPFYDKENKPIIEKWEVQQVRLLELK